MEEQGQYIPALPSTAAGVLELMPASRAQVDVFSDQLIESVRNGELDPIQLRATFKALEMVMDRVSKETLPNALTAADKYPGERFEAYGCSIQKGDTYTAYDYASSGDPVYAQRFKIAEQAKEQLKEREAFLKAVKSVMTIVDEGTGEVVTIKPPVKKSIPGLKFTVK